MTLANYKDGDLRLFDDPGSRRRTREWKRKCRRFKTSFSTASGGTESGNALGILIVHQNHCPKIESNQAFSAFPPVIFCAIPVACNPEQKASGLASRRRNPPYVCCLCARIEFLLPATRAMCVFVPNKRGAGDSTSACMQDRHIPKLGMCEYVEWARRGHSI